MPGKAGIPAMTGFLAGFRQFNTSQVFDKLWHIVWHFQTMPYFIIQTSYFYRKDLFWDGGKVVSIVSNAGYLVGSSLPISLPGLPGNLISGSAPEMGTTNVIKEAGWLQDLTAWPTGPRPFAVLLKRSRQRMGALHLTLGDCRAHRAGLAGVPWGGRVGHFHRGDAFCRQMVGCPGFACSLGGGFLTDQGVQPQRPGGLFPLPVRAGLGPFFLAVFLLRRRRRLYWG